jgi:hypothetical protein
MSALPAYLRLTDAEIEHWGELYLRAPRLHACGISFQRFLSLPIDRRERLVHGLEPWPELLPRQVAVRDAAFDAEREAERLPRHGTAAAPFEKLKHAGRTHRWGRARFRPATPSHEEVTP